MGSVELKFGSDTFPLYKGSYSLSITNKETVNETEAGTLIRDIKRTNVPKLSVSQPIEEAWYQTLSTYNDDTSITFSYYDPVTLTAQTFSGFMQNLKFDLVADLTKTHWNASFDIVAY